MENDESRIPQESGIKDRELTGYELSKTNPEGFGTFLAAVWRLPRLEGRRTIHKLKEKLHTTAGKRY